MTQMTSPNLIRGLNTRYISNILSGDLSFDEDLAAVQAAMNEGGTFVWDRPVYCLNRNIGSGSGILNIGALKRFIGEPELCLDMSLMPNSGTPRYAFFTPSGDQTPANLTSDAIVGQNFVSVGAANIASLGLEVGHHVSITADKVFIDGGTAGAENQGERPQISKIDGDDVYVTPALQDTYLVSDGATIRRVIMHEKVQVEGVSVKGCGQFATDTIGDRGFHLIHMNRLRMVDCNASFCDNGNYLYSSTGVVDGFGYQFDLQSIIPRNANQYGLAYVNACQDLTIKRTDGIGGKHGIVQSESDFVHGVSRRVSLLDNTVRSTWNYGVATHTNAAFLFFERNKLFDCNGGVEFGCRDVYSKSNQVFNTPDVIGDVYSDPSADPADGKLNLLGTAFNIADIADNINSTADKAYRGRYGLRLSDSQTIFSGSAGPRNINIMDFFSTDAAQAGISIKSNHVGTNSDIHITRPTTRRTGNSSDGVTAAVSIEIDGDFDKVSIKNGDLQSVAGNASGCITTANVRDAHVTDNLYSGHAVPIIAGAVGANIVTRNNEEY